MGPKRKSPNRSKSPKKAENSDLTFFTTPLYDVRKTLIKNKLNKKIKFKQG